MGLTLFDASGTTGASRFLWDLNGNGQADVECGGNQPFLATRLISKATLNVQLTAVSSGGLTSRTSQTVSVTGGLSRRTAASAPQVALCATAKAALMDQRAGCTGRVIFGVIEARGCLEAVTSAQDIPSGEKPILQALVTEFNTEPQLRDYVVQRCQEINLRNCTRFETEIDLRETRGLLSLDVLDIFVSRRPNSVLINGVVFKPESGGAIVLSPQLGRIVSANASMKLGDTIPVPGSRKVNIDVEGKGKLYNGIFDRPGRVTLFSFNAGSALPDLAGFHFDGQVDLTFVRDSSFRRYTEAGVRVALPKVFNLFGGDPPSGQTKFIATNDLGVVLDKLSIRVPEASLGALRFANVGFDYSASGNFVPQNPALNCSRGWWKATADIFLGALDTGKDAGFVLSPPPPQNGIAFCAADGAPYFRSAGGELHFGTAIPPPQVFPGVFLDEVNFAVGLNPTLIRGGGALSAVEISTVRGTLFSVFASPDAPYTLTAGDTQEELAPLTGRKLTSTAVALGGTFGFNIPFIGNVPFGNAYFMYEYPNHIVLGGGMRFGSPLMLVYGRIDGEMLIRSNPLYSFHGQIGAEIAEIGSLGVEGWVTNIGVVVCGDIADLHPGAGYKWGDPLPEIWIPDGCKPSHYWPNFNAAAAQSGELSFDVEKGEDSKSVKLSGQGGAPQVQVTSPGGETISTVSGNFVNGNDLVLLRQPTGNRTYIGVKNGPVGKYTVTTLNGSPGISGLAETRKGYDKPVRGSVTGKGRKRTLHYNARPLAHKKVTFFESGPGTYARIGVAKKKGKGEIPFTPAPGPRGKRDIVAVVLIDGIPAPQQVIASYKAPPPVQAGRPGKLRVKRRGKKIIAKWRRADNATAYGVVLRQRNGVQKMRRLKKRAHRVRFKGVAKTQKGTVAVRALGPLGDWSRSRKDKFRATKRAHTRRHPFSELRKKP